MQTVHVRINDAATGQPTPCRVRFTDAAGNYYPPLGRLKRFSTAVNEDVGGNVLVNSKEYSYIDGACEVPLPAGSLRVEVHKGPEFTSIFKEVELPAGKLSLRFEISRSINLRDAGWLSGDTRALFLSPHACLLEAAAEDLAVANLLAFETESGAVPNLLAFSGQKPALEGPGHMVVVNTLNVAGSVELALLNCHRVVYPLSFKERTWDLASWCGQCHRKQGLVVWSGGWDDAKAFRLAQAGDIDCIELADDRALETWYRLLSLGIKTSIVGSGRKDSNAKLLGGTRTYAQLQPGEELNYKNWIEAIRAGRTFVTRGPLLSIELAGSRITAHVRGQSKLCRLQLVADGHILAELKPGESSAIEHEVPSARWLAARCVEGDKVIAHTSAIHCDGERRAVRPT